MLHHRLYLMPPRRIASLGFCALLLLTGCTSRVGACDERSLADFWNEFRDAALSSDIRKLQSLASFPLATRGTSDGDPLVQHSAEEFAALWAQLIEQDPGLELSGETLRDYIARHERVPDDALDVASASARIADLEFSCSAGVWRLTMAYTGE